LASLTPVALRFGPGEGQREPPANTRAYAREPDFYGESECASWGCPPYEGEVAHFSRRPDVGNLSAMAQTVLIVDDHAGFRLAARAVLEADGYDVVAESATGLEALEAAQRHQPDLVLLDICLPDVDGIEVAVRLTTADRGLAVVLTSSRDASDYQPHLSESGARGFIPKAELSGAAVAAITA
jgi:CheY-like chemotaxis protein